MIFSNAYAHRQPIARRAGQPVLVGNGHRALAFIQWVNRSGGDARDRMLIPTPNRVHLKEEVVTMAEGLNGRATELPRWGSGTWGRSTTQRN